MDPWRAVKSGLVFSGEIDSDRLPRLCALAGLIRPGRFELRFGREDGGQATVTGWVRLTLRMTCQRCMDEMDLPVDAAISWGLLRTDAESTKLADHLEPVIVGDGTISPWDLLEDEVLLAIPHVPRHPAELCPGGMASQTGAEAADLSTSNEVAPERPGPFAVLANLKTGRPDDETGKD
jgi:uncharacterized protein